MQAGALRALEFDRIVDAVKALALTPMGAERLARLAPSTDAHRVAQLLAQTSETTRFVEAHGTFPLRATVDLPGTLAALAVEGRALEPPRLRTTLESYLRGKETAKYLQEQVVTERNGRYVLVVKTEHRGGIPGIVHGASTSGASLYLEPLSTVEINNDIVATEEQEAEEVRRILLAL